MEPFVRAPLRIFLAEESDAIVSQLRAWCAPSHGVFLIDAFPSSRQLLRRVEVERPDLVLIGLALRHTDGLTALRQLRPSGVPVVILSPDTLEGARGTLEALLAGAVDCLVVRTSPGRERVALTRARFARRLMRWMGAEPLDFQAADAGTWFRMAMDTRGHLVAGVPTAQPFPAHEAWLGAAFCRTQSLGRLLRSLASAPERPAGGMLLGTSLPPRFTHALAEAATRLWNRVVLELQPGEPMRPGQWRVIPGRMVLQPLALRDAAIQLDWEGGRWSGERELLARRIDALRGPVPLWTRLYLFDEPEPRLMGPLTRLTQSGGAILLHGDRFPLEQWVDHDAREPFAQRDATREASRARRAAA
jgi:chemotaxis response regulator CheB